MSKQNKPGNGQLVLSGYWSQDGSHGVKNQFRIDDNITVTIGKVAHNRETGRYRVELVFHAPEDVEIWRETLYREFEQ